MGTNVLSRGGVWCGVVLCDVVCAFVYMIIMINQFTVHPDCL